MPLCAQVFSPCLALLTEQVQGQMDLMLDSTNWGTGLLPGAKGAAEVFPRRGRPAQGGGAWPGQLQEPGASFHPLFTVEIQT